MSSCPGEAKATGAAFDVANKADFYRWATPILLHIIKYGKSMKPPPFSVQGHRKVFQRVLNEMMCMGYWAVEEGLSDEDKATVNTWYKTWGTNEAPDVDWVIHNWENILYRWQEELMKGEWHA